MKCSRCQHENNSGARFCEECGASLASECGNCGALLSATAKFCSNCGQPAGAKTRSHQRFGSLEAYTPKHLAERIITSRSALEGERKQVTVLFADIKGSMELLAERDPEEAREILDPTLERMMEAVHRYEGTVNQVMGDGIMALFGAPLAHEDHAVRACYAALLMQESIGRYGEELRRAIGMPLQIRVGLNSGEVVVRSIGSDLRMDYTAVGQTTHLAARMEQAALPGSILITHDTLRLAEGYIQVKPLGPFPIKGLDAPMEIYEVTGAGSVRSRMEAAAARGLTRFVGRDAELEILRQALDKARDGDGEVVSLVGEPGVGKSRLLWEFIHSHRMQGWLVLESSSSSYGKGMPYLPVIDLLKGYFQIEARDDARKIRERLTGKLLTLDPALQATLPAFLSLLDVPIDDAQWQALDPPQRRQRTLEALKRLLLRESQVQPLCLALEDLHWIDSESQAFVDNLVESLPTARVLLFVNYRPEYHHEWGSKSYYTQLRLDPLPPDSAEEFLRGLLGSDSALGALKQQLIKQTQGNPFFLEESVRTLVETQVLAGQRGAYRLAKALPSIQVPATVQAVLAARIDRLPPQEKRFLQAAAVIGEEVPFVLLQAIAEEPEATLRAGLAHLQAAEFLYEARLFPDLEYTFKHGLTYQVAYGSLLQERRRALHARIVEALERLYSDRLAEHTDRLGHHALRGEVWGKAVGYLRQAGTRAFARSAHREAVAWFEQAQSALQHVPESSETLEQAIDLRFDLRNSLWALGELSAVFEHLRQAEQLARRLDDQRRLGRASMYMSSGLWVTGRSIEARAFGKSALAIAETLGDLPLKVGANLYLGTSCLALGDYRQAEAYLRKTVQSLEGDLSRERCGLAGFPAAMARSYLTMALAERGEFDDGIAQGQQGVRIAEALDHPYSLVVASRGLAFLYGLRGEFAHAVRLLERALHLCRDMNLFFLSPSVMGFLGSVYARSGRVAEGISLLEQTLNAGADWDSSIRFTQLGEAVMLAANFEEALPLAQRALTLTRERGERGYEAHTLRMLGEISCQRDSREAAEAEKYYGQALALAADLGMLPLVAHCHLGLGTLFRRADKGEEAKPHLATAATMYRAMNMGFWLEKAGVRA